MSEPKHYCSSKVFDESIRRAVGCSKPAKFERDGRWFCTIHAPDYVEKKNAERRARRDAISAANTARFRLQAAAPDLLAACKLALDIIGHPDDAGTKIIAEAVAKAEGRS